MMKRPELLEEANKSTILNQINSRLQSVLEVSGIKKEDFNTSYSTNPEDSFSSPSYYSSSNNTTSIHTPSASVNVNLSTWEQFESIKRQDYGGVSEEAFLRELIYVLQGLEGNLLLFNKAEDRYIVNDRLHVARPIRSLVEKLGRIGSDYRFLQNQIGVHRESNGILRQSFCRAMAYE